MAEFEVDNAGNSEAQQKQGLSYLFAQSSTGLATAGVLAGLAVTQTTTASGSVLVAAGAGVVQPSVLAGASVLVNDTSKTLDVFTAAPMGGLPRNDVVVFDASVPGIVAVTGTPNATPSDPAVTSSQIPLARLRHSASATTIPSSAIDDLRTFTGLAATRRPYITLRRSLSNPAPANAVDSTLSGYDGSADRYLCTESGGVVTVPIAGRYSVTAQGMWAANGTGIRRMRITKNGTSDIVAVDQNAGVAGDGVSTTATNTITLAAGDTVRVQLFHNSGAATLALAATSSPAFFSVQYVGVA